jgi:hypothetical protein
LGPYVLNPNATLEPSSLECLSMLRFDNRPKLAELGIDLAEALVWRGLHRLALPCVR